MNESLERTLSLIKDRLSNLPPNGRAVVMLVLVTVIAAVFVWSGFPSGPADEYLFSGRSFSKAELWVIEAALATAQLQNYSIEDGRVRVPATQRSLYVQAITDGNALPPGLYDPTEAALKESNLIEPGSLRDLRFSHADEKKAALAVKSVSGVEDAFVHYDETPQRGLHGKQDITALVGVLSHDHQPLEAEVLQTIHEIVLAWKAGLRAENVTVVDLRGGRTVRGNPRDAVESSSSPYASLRRTQDEWTSHVKTVLRFIPEAQVAVSLLMPSGRSLDARSSTAQGPHGSGDSLTHVPPRVAISVQVPTSYLRQVWQARHASKRPSSEDLAGIERETCAKIRSAVAPLLTGTSHNDSAPVSITTYDAPLQNTDHESASESLAWLTEHWRIAFVVAVAFAALAFLLLTRRMPPAKSRDTAEQPFQVVRDEPQQPSSAPTPARQEADAALRDQLQTLVQRDPAAAAQTLADWIDKAG